MEYYKAVKKIKIYLCIVGYINEASCKTVW